MNIKHVLLLLVVLSMSCAPVQPTEVGSGPSNLVTFQSCVNFTVFPDNTPIPNGWRQAGMVFTSSGSLYVNQMGSGKGLVFPDAGLDIAMPVSVPKVDMIVGAYNAPITVTGLDAANNVVATLTIPASNSFNPYSLTGGPIFTVRFVGGGFEGALQEICIELTDC